MLADLLKQAVEQGQMGRFEFLQADRERALLLDHLGACERILKTPLARPYSIKIRRFLFLYLLALPFGIVDKSGALTPVLTLMVAYPLLSLDQIGVELQSPFDTRALGHLPLTEICRSIERDVLSLETQPDETQPANGRPRQGAETAPDPLAAGIIPGLTAAGPQSAGSSAQFPAHFGIVQ
jgi:putative membrane protein